MAIFLTASSYLYSFVDLCYTMPLVDLQAISKKTYIHLPIFIVLVSLTPCILAFIFLTVLTIYYLINSPKMQSNESSIQTISNNQNINNNFELELRTHS